MSIEANPNYFEAEAAGEVNHVLVAVRYVGNSRRYSNPATHQHGRWPTSRDWQHGEWHVGFVPEDTPDGDTGMGIAWFERRNSFEVSYDPEHIAALLLEWGVEEHDVTTPRGPIGDGDHVPNFEEKVMDALGLSDPIEAGKPIRDQLIDLAGGPPETAEVSPVDRFVNEYSRADLKDLVDDVREDASEIHLGHASMRDMAEYLVDNGVEP